MLVYAILYLLRTFNVFSSAIAFLGKLLRRWVDLLERVQVICRMIHYRFSTKLRSQMSPKPA